MIFIGKQMLFKNQKLNVFVFDANYNHFVTYFCVHFITDVFDSTSRQFDFVAFTDCVNIE